MLGLALLFLIIALVAGALDLWVISATSFSIAKILFFVFLVLFVVALIMSALRGRPTDVV